MDGGSVVAGYFRVSKARDDMHAPEIYTHEIERYCHYRGMKLAKIYSDIDHSGWKDPHKRPGLRQLLDERDRYSAIIVPKLSRFGRSMSHLIELFELFDGEGIGLVFLDLQIDTGTSQGKLFRHIVAAFAQYESDVKSDYGIANHDHRVREGRPNGPGAYGYIRKGDTLVVSEPEASIVRDIYTSYVAGASMVGIVRSLNERGIPSATGKRWIKQSLRALLERPTYAGMQRRNGVLVQANWEPLIDPDVWATVQQRRQSVSNRGVCVRSGLYLLSKMITCDVCGTTLYHRTKQDRSPGQYLCRGTEHTGYCIGGAIAEHRAEEMVTSAYLERYGETFITTEGVTSTIAERWDAADFQARRELLRTAISRITLIRRPPGNIRGTGLPRGRKLRIEWTHHLDVLEPAVFTPAREPSDSAKVCSLCGRRRHISNFRLQDGDRVDVCTPCKPAAVRLPAPALRKRKSWAVWSRELVRWRQLPAAERGAKPEP